MRVRIRVGATAFDELDESNTLERDKSFIYGPTLRNSSVGLPGTRIIIKPGGPETALLVSIIGWKPMPHQNTGAPSGRLRSGAKSLMNCSSIFSVSISVRSGRIQPAVTFD